jgi:hypothetical protein
VKLEAAKPDIPARLETGGQALTRSFEGANQRQSLWKASDRSWSILECGEHLALAEEFLLSRLRRAEFSPAAASHPIREARILDRALDRSTHIESPDPGKPLGRYTNVHDALAGFSAARAGTTRWVEDQEGDLRFRLTDHPMIPGPVTYFEILLMISAHPIRHAEQIKMIRTNFAIAAPTGTGGARPS